MRVAVVFLGLLTVALAGCVTGDVPDVRDLADTDAAGPRLGLESALPQTPRDSATLDAGPEWRLGEWWRINFDAPPYGIEATFDRVVAGTDTRDDTYLVGMNADEWNDGVMLLHFPAFGKIGRTTMTFDAHDIPIELVRFPLTEGATWPTQWYNGAPLHATVDEIKGDRALIQITGSRDIHVTYDATIGAITKLTISDYGSYEVIDHGYGYEGLVRVPADQDLVFCHGRALLVQAVDLCVLKEATAPRGPTDIIDIPTRYTGMSFGLFLADVQDTGDVAPGVLKIDVRDPQQNAYGAIKTPDEPGFLLQHYGRGDPAGQWEITAGAAGAGLAILEGTAYTVYEIDFT